VRSTYLDIARADPERVRIIDATGDVEAIRKALQAHLAFG
jgi:thymidylate kinase